jgi:peptidoglycan hydrolase CwlO-like protein
MRLFLSNKFLIPVSTCTSNDTIFEKIEQNAEKSVMKELQQLSDAQCKLGKQDDKLKEINNERKNLKRKLQRSIPKMEHLKKLKIEVNAKKELLQILKKNPDCRK